MSVESLAVVLHHSRAQGTAKLVLIGIANHDGDGGAWPRVNTLAGYANVDERSVRRALRLLEQLGELAVTANGGGTADAAFYERPNLYRILVRCPPECDHSPQHRVTNGGKAGATPGDASVPTPGDASVPTPGDASVPTPGDASVPTPGDASVPLTIPSTIRVTTPPTRPPSQAVDDVAAELLPELLDVRSQVGLTTARWGLRSVRDALQRAVEQTGHPPALAARALRAVAADPATQLPGRVVAPGPWWEVAERTAQADRAQRQQEDQQRRAALVAACRDCDAGGFLDQDGPAVRCLHPAQTQVRVAS